MATYRPLLQIGFLTPARMRIVVAPDSFKESLSAPEAAHAIAEGIRRVCPDAEILEVPMADGGEGTVEALVQATCGEIVQCTATGPLGEPVEAFYGRLGSGNAVVVEMAASSGLHLVPKDRRDARNTTTRGTGELILRALGEAPDRLIVGIGGSATNDAGAGMAQALGYRLLDAEGCDVAPGGAALSRLARIVRPGMRPWDGVDIVVACDVTNPLTGPKGASRVYGPQKGATPSDVAELDAALAHFADIVYRDLGIGIQHMPGAGAAGGLGGGLVAFLGATIRRGVEIMAEASGLEAAVEGTDLVFTAEGRLDGQSVHGKTPVGVAHIAQRHGVPCVALAGALGDGYRAVYGEGVTAALAITAGPETLENALAHTGERLSAAAEAVVRIWIHASGQSE